MSEYWDEEWYLAPKNPDRADEARIATTRQVAEMLARERKEMHWFGPGEVEWSWTGQTMDLGMAIPRDRKYPWQWFMWDIAYGYVNGFPLGHVLYFALTRNVSKRVRRRIIARNVVRNETGIRPAPRALVLK